MATGQSIIREKLTSALGQISTSPVIVVPRLDVVHFILLNVAVRDFLLCNNPDLFSYKAPSEWGYFTLIVLEQWIGFGVFVGKAQLSNFLLQFSLRHP